MDAEKERERATPGRGGRNKSREHGLRLFLFRSAARLSKLRNGGTGEGFRGPSLKPALLIAALVSEIQREVHDQASCAHPPTRKPCRPLIQSNGSRYWRSNVIVDVAWSHCVSYLFVLAEPSCGLPWPRAPARKKQVARGKTKYHKYNRRNLRFAAGHQACPLFARYGSGSGRRSAPLGTNSLTSCPLN